jgi:hypothetical protein
MDYVNKQNYVPVVRNYVQGATAEYTDLQNRLKQDYDNTASQYDALQEAKDSMKYIKGSKGDEEAYKQAFDLASKEIDEAARVGDYENRGRLARKAIKNFQENYNPIFSRYNQYQENIKKISEMKDLTENDKFAAIKSLNENYINNPQYNEKGKVVLNNWQEYLPHKNEDRQKIIGDFADKITKQEWANLPNIQNIKGYDYFVKLAREERTPERIYQLASAYAAQQPEIQMDLEREAKLLPYKQNIKDITNSKEFQKWVSPKINFKNKEEEDNFNNNLLNGNLQKQFYKEKLLHSDLATTAEKLKIHNFKYDLDGMTEYDKLRLKSKYDKEVASENTVLTEVGNQDISEDFKTQNENINIQKQSITSNYNQMLESRKYISDLVKKENEDKVLEDFYNNKPIEEISKKYNVDGIKLLQYYNDYKEAQDNYIKADKSKKYSERFLNDVQQNKNLKINEKYDNYLKNFSNTDNKGRKYQDNGELGIITASSKTKFTEATLKYLNGEIIDPKVYSRDLVQFVENNYEKEKDSKILNKVDLKYGIQAEGTAIGEQMNNIAKGIESNPMNYKIAGQDANVYTKLVNDGKIDASDNNPQIKVIEKTYGLGTVNNNPYYLIKLKVGEGKDSKEVSYKIDASLNKEVHDRGIKELYDKTKDKSVKEQIEFDYVQKQMPEYIDAYKLEIGNSPELSKGVIINGKNAADGKVAQYKIARAIEPSSKNNLINKDGKYTGKYVLYQNTPNGWQSVKQQNNNQLLFNDIDAIFTEIGNIELN